MNLILGVAALGSVVFLWTTSKRGIELWRTHPPVEPLDALSTDPGLLKRHSQYRFFRCGGFTYNRLRIFYRDHPQADKLPKEPSPLPLLVFIHGLGGSVAQFHPLLSSLANVAPCLAVDLPGCGLSEFHPRDWDAYTQDALAHLLAMIIDGYLEPGGSRGFVLVGHSMGCSLAAHIATRSPLENRCLGVVAVCPRADTVNPNDPLAKLVRIPEIIFNAFRWWDRQGGIDSPSVSRLTGTQADRETKKLQLKYNAQSKTPVWRRVATGTIRRYREDTLVGLGMAGKETWEQIDVPLLIVAGAADHITKPEDAEQIKEWVDEYAARSSKSSETGPTKHVPVELTILPAPATHALLYATATSRALAGLIETFLGRHIDPRLSSGWQLQHLTIEGKWEVKNLTKWQKAQNVSAPIAGIFRAMKTLREVDQEHSPKAFAAAWSTRIGVVIDLSHDRPVYNPDGLQQAGILYQKFPTVSKMPPTDDEVRNFVTLVDQLRTDEALGHTGERAIGVHCHYGFNRTGFFIVCYLVERENWSLPAALEEFAACRPPGIRHAHFIDILYVKYGLRGTKQQGPS